MKRTFNVSRTIADRDFLKSLADDKIVYGDAVYDFTIDNKFIVYHVNVLDKTKFIVVNMRPFCAFVSVVSDGKKLRKYEPTMYNKRFQSSLIMESKRVPDGFVMSREDIVKFTPLAYKALEFTGSKEWALLNSEHESSDGIRHRRTKDEMKTLRASLNKSAA